jgi:hypothetical protein
LIEGGSEKMQILAAARLLAAHRPTGAALVVLNYLPLADETTEEELLTTLGAVTWRADGRSDPALVTALRDPQPARRAAAALWLGRANDAMDREAVRPLLGDVDAKVRLRAAQGLLAGKDKNAVPTLLALLSDAPLELAWQAEELLGRLAGEARPRASLGSTSPERHRCREAWEGWWHTVGSFLDISSLDLNQRLLGLTLLVSYDGYRGSGRVWECGLDGKPRWEITDVRGPLDARMLSGSRVLIAEYDGRRVTERDLQGRVLWQHPIKGQPVGCLRLPNGNTLVVTNAEIIEVSPAGAQVAVLKSGHGMIGAIDRAADGHLFYLTLEGVMVELDDKGQEVKTYKVDRATDGLITVECMPGGRFLVAQSSANQIVEVDRTGKVLWHVTVSSPNSASRLPNGNTLVVSRSNRTVVEIDRAGKVLWEQRQEGHLFRAHRR